MNIYNFLVSPISKSKLILEQGKLIGDSEEYLVVDGIPSMVVVTDEEKNNLAMSSYETLSKSYDDYHHLTYEIFYQNEEDARNSMIDKLHLNADARVLELNAGTGRDSVLIQKRLNSNGELHVQDISMGMLRVLKPKFVNSDVPIYITQSNATKLPYPDNFFDALYSFSGVAMSRYDGHAAYKEIARVVKPHGRVVIGGHGLAPWLDDTLFAKILLNHNESYKSKFDLAALPVEARDVSVSWILSGTAFVIDFTIGEGEPPADFDRFIPGIRGGTLRTRYLGQLEGVSLETKESLMKVRGRLGVSVHEWLDNIVKREILKLEDSK